MACALEAEMATRKVTSRTGLRREREACAAGLATLFLLMLFALSSPAAAAVTAVGGYDHYAGAFGQRTDGVVGAVVVGIGSGDVTAAGVRYDDSLIGEGYSVVGGVGLPLAPTTMLRASGTRFIGDESFRAWRVKVGPQFALPGERSLTLSYSRYQDNLASRSNGVIAEATSPLVPKLGGKATGSVATTSDGPTALQGSVGLSWSPVRRLELSGEVGVARNAAGAAGQPFPNRGPLDGLPLVGGGSGGGGSSGSSQEVAGTALISVRVSVP
jgi:hypothetical protein